MKSFLLIIVFTFFLSGFFTTDAQSPEKEDVIAVIEQLFDGMRESDSSKVANTFTGDPIMQTIGRNAEGKMVANKGSWTGFLRAVGTQKNEIWDERISHYDINIDEELATVWTPYQFYRGETFSHCGVNSFQLIKKAEGWKIFFIVDTRRQDNCIAKAN